MIRADRQPEIRFSEGARMRRHSSALIIIVALLLTSFAVAHADGDRGRKDFALGFSEAAGSSATGPAIGRLDNLRMEALVKWNGPSANGGLIVNNGNGCCNGWGILLHGTNDGGNFVGKLAILAGGVTIVESSYTLPVGRWQLIRVESNGQLVTLSFPGAVHEGPVYSFGVVPRNGLNVGQPSTLTIGEHFNGVIDNVRFTSLDTPNTTLEWFRFNEGRGITTTGVNGTVLNLTGTTWVRLDNDGR
jgi:hypothetical protein